MLELTFLEEGEYTKRDENIKNIVRELKDKPGTLRKNISMYVADLKVDKTFKDEVYRKRDASRIIESGYITGCTDAALAFVTLCRQAGIPARYVDTFEEDWLKNIDPNHIRGHVFTELLTGNAWMVYEPIGGFTKHNKYVLNNRKYIEVGTGLDFSQIYIKESKEYKENPIGIYTYDDMNRIALKMSKDRGFDI